MPKVNPEILVWARESAGLSLEEAAHRLGLSGPERLQALEAGEREPSRRQLANMAERYRRPLLTFYLTERPRDSDKGQDFRTLRDGRVPEAEALLNALLRDVHARQGIIKAALEEAEENVSLPFVGSARLANGVENLARAIGELLNYTAANFRQQRNVDDAFSTLRAATERAGVFVLLMGNLGTHHTDIDPTIFRGFSLSDDVAPFIVINEKDSRAAWSFTLLHELTHIFLGQTAISGYDGEAEVERFCDSVAGRFFLNPDELAALGIGPRATIDQILDVVSAFAADTNLSRKMIAYNLLRQNHISGVIYRQLVDIFDRDRRAVKKDRPNGDNGPNYYVVRRHRIGPRLINVVQRMISGGALSTTKAGRVLGVKPTAVNRIVGGNQAA